MVAVALLCAFVPAQTPPPSAGVAVKLILRTGHGAGVHIGDGRILTAGHLVIAQGSAGPFGVRTDQGDQGTAIVLWHEPGYDLALLQSDLRGVARAPVSCQAQPIGTDLHAVSNPYDHEFTHTWGRVASLPKPSLPQWQSVIAVDMTGGPGSSGGPLLDAAGAVVGIFVGGYTGKRERSFLVLAVPSTAICPLLIGLTPDA